MQKQAEDQFEEYFTEKIWEMIPAVYRHEDDLGDRRGTLRALVEVMAGQAALVRRSQDRLWEDQFIAWCSDWAVPYIGELLGTRLLPALNARGRRVDVAKTIYYRRRKGTPRVLEELISDISGWEGKLVESFGRLARAHHGLDPKPAGRAGRFTGTPPGGTADLRRQRASELAGSPFDEFYYTPDVRQQRGRQGRYGIPKLAFHLYRLVAYPVRDVTPFALGDGRRFTFDPSGRDIPLFNRRRRAETLSERRRRPQEWENQRAAYEDWEQWQPAEEWELPAPMRCRLLAHAEYLVTEEVIDALERKVPPLSPAAANELRRFRGWQFRDEGQLRVVLGALVNRAELLSAATFVPLLGLALVTACGKQALLPSAAAVLAGASVLDAGSLAVRVGAAPGAIVPAEYITAAHLGAWSAAPFHKQLAVDPEHGRFLFLGTPVAVPVSATYHYGFSGPVGAGTYARGGVEEAPADRTVPAGGGPIAAGLLADGTTEVADSRTYGPVASVAGLGQLTLRAADQQRPYLRLEADWVLDTGANREARLSLNGLWIGGAGNAACALVLRGDYEMVTIRCCTLDPGGAQNANGEALHPVRLRVEGRVETLCIEDSIVGPVTVGGAGLVEEVVICDSVVQATDPAVPAFDVPAGLVTLRRSTVLGRIGVHRLQASEVIVTGAAAVTDTQAGCFRFSAAPAGSRLPRPYQSFLFPADTRHWFTSRLFGQPGYAQLSDTAPVALRSGAENGSEMGVFSRQLNPVKLAGLRTKIEEYMPFGLIPAFIHET